ncbi:bifunctional 2-methylcitrate dehydratase/aconitate hydratase [Micromonospora sp. NPDC047738]|uniref:bifunctional 2-methylcitrate dehydratase/aconitate hydratase n=1 Tax=Micromonospora sp. NPDC047738 TaxID=3155741 RepID=UPI00340C0A15
MSAAYDDVLVQIAEYAAHPERIESELALRTAHLSFLDATACAFLGLADAECRRTAEPLFPTAAPHPSRVLATGYATDPVQAAFSTGTLIRWLDFNDTWLALEWGHPSDNLAAILPLADHLAQRARAAGGTPPTVRDVLVAMIQAHEIQGVLALGTALNRHGLDHVAYVRIASAAVATRLLGGSEEDIRRALGHAWVDGGALRTYRHTPNVTWRKSWAAGDAASRAVRLAYLALRGAESPRTPLTAKGWGFQDSLLGGHQVALPQPLGSYVMENVLLKPWFPAEYHGQTAVEAAFRLAPAVRDRVTAIDRIEIRTHEAAVRIIDKTGPLANPADRDHCLQYMVAIALLHGRLDEEHYTDEAAAEPRVDALRERMIVTEDPEYSRAYLDPAERAVANALRITFSDGTDTGWQEIRIPIGHPRRRPEAEPLVRDKLRRGLRAALDAERAELVAERLADRGGLLDTPADDLLDLLVVR